MDKWLEDYIEQELSKHNPKPDTPLDKHKDKYKICQSWRRYNLYGKGLN